MEERVRYSRDGERNPKNTLVTLSEGDIIYFGIARCNNQKDMVVKKLGKGIARSRANLSYEQGKGTDSSDLSLYVHSSGLRGWCLKDNILGLLDYFESLDDLAPGFQFCYCTDCSKFLSPFV